MDDVQAENRSGGETSSSIDHPKPPTKKVKLVRHNSRPPPTTDMNIPSQTNNNDNRTSSQTNGEKLNEVKTSTNSTEATDVSEEAETPEERCEKLAARLRGKLNTAAGSDRYKATETERGAQELANGREIRKACGQIEEGDEHVLKPYQLVGVNFLLLLSETVGGAIIADEMGLGKTAQCISFLAAKKEGVRQQSYAGNGHSDRGEAKPALIVAPASLLENWQAELAEWAPNLRVQAYYGKDRGIARNRLAEYQPGGRLEEEGIPFDVLLTCYTLYERKSEEQKEDRKWLVRWNFSTMVLDEAHQVKNRNSTRATQLRRMLKATEFRVMLTGTPLQNDLSELESLLQLLAPEVFEEGPESLFTDGDGNDTAVAKAKRVLAPFTLRRLKEEVMSQLAPKNTNNILVKMSARQQKLYDDAVSQLKQQMGNTAANASATRLKSAFTHLRKVANHPLLVRSNYLDDHLEEISAVCDRKQLFGLEANREKVRQHVRGLSDYALHQLCNDFNLSGELFHLRMHKDSVYESGKTQKLVEIMRHLKQKGSRPLIFSQWKMMLDVIEWALHNEGHEYTRLDGDTPVDERLSRVKRFNMQSSPLFAFVLSTRAGGQGLNLTGADTVIIHDPDYTPSVDRQAVDRAHRIGQSKPVKVYRLVCTGTVDERILEIANEKQGLDEAVLASDSAVPSSNDESRSIGQIVSELLSA